MRQQRHTTAYARSWQPSGDTAALHRHSSEINASHKKAPATCPGLSFPTVKRRRWPMGVAVERASAQAE